MLRPQAAIGAFRHSRRQGRVHIVSGRIQGRANGARRLRAAVLRPVQGPVRMQRFRLPTLRLHFQQQWFDYCLV